MAAPGAFEAPGPNIWRTSKAQVEGGSGPHKEEEGQGRQEGQGRSRGTATRSPNAPPPGRYPGGLGPYIDDIGLATVPPPLSDR